MPTMPTPGSTSPRSTAERGQYDAGDRQLRPGNRTQAPEDYDSCLRRGHAYRQLHKYPRGLGRLRPRRTVGSGQGRAAVESRRRSPPPGPMAIGGGGLSPSGRLDHRSGRAYQSAAWFLATCPVDRYRNADLAVQAAEKALELDGETDIKYLDTVAAAYANAGQFDKACQMLARILECETGGRRVLTVNGSNFTRNSNLIVNRSQRIPPNADSSSKAMRHENRRKRNRGI